MVSLVLCVCHGASRVSGQVLSKFRVLSGGSLVACLGGTLLVKTSFACGLLVSFWLLVRQFVAVSHV
jgi:hypothetical protein